MDVLDVLSTNFNPSAAIQEVAAAMQRCAARASQFFKL
jgi:hypothetical protein